MNSALPMPDKMPPHRKHRRISFNVIPRSPQRMINASTKMITLDTNSEGSMSTCRFERTTTANAENAIAVSNAMKLP